MSRRRRYQPNHKKSSTFALNITSMTDMFTIMLVFLLQTYGTSNINLEIQKDIRLPSSSTPLNPTEGLRLSLTTTALKIDDTELVKIENQQFDKSSLDTNDSNFILPLFAELDRRMKDPEVKQHIKEGKILFQADARIPYGTLRKVMYTASMAGYPQLKLVTTIGN